MKVQTTVFCRVAFGLLLCLGVLGCSRGSGQAEAPAVRKFVIALKPDKNPELMLQEKTALEGFLSERLGRPVETIIPLSSAVILEGLANRTIDLGYLSAADMINARELGAADILLAGEINGHPHYQSYWVTLREKPYRSVADLRGKPVAFSGKTSTSGFVVPLWDLRQKGLVSEAGDPVEFFGRGNIFYGIGYVSAVERVLAGDVEAAAISYYVLDKDKHLTVEQRARLRKMAEQGPVPTHVLAVRRSIGAEDRRLLRDALLGLNEAEHEGLRDRLFTSRLIEVDADRHLGGLHEALRLASRALNGK